MPRRAGTGGDGRRAPDPPPATSHPGGTDAGRTIQVVRHAANAGCKIIGITGRCANQRLATIDNLTEVGYYSRKTDRPLFKSQYHFIMWSGSAPPYISCATEKCSTIEYESQTRKHVEDHFGFHIIADFGDQFSDLVGGSSDRVVKLPNPTYHLP